METLFLDDLETRATWPPVVQSTSVLGAAVCDAKHSMALRCSFWQPG